VRRTTVGADSDETSDGTTTTSAAAAAHGSASRTEVVVFAAVVVFPVPESILKIDICGTVIAVEIQLMMMVHNSTGRDAVIHVML
jgi:hypothetical protein